MTDVVVQTAVLGMHATKDKPWVDSNGQIVVRPIMVVALTYGTSLLTRPLLCARPLTMYRACRPPSPGRPRGGYVPRPRQAAHRGPGPLCPPLRMSVRVTRPSCLRIHHPVQAGRLPSFCVFQAEPSLFPSRHPPGGQECSPTGSSSSPSPAPLHSDIQVAYSALVKRWVVSESSERNNGRFPVCGCGKFSPGAVGRRPLCPTRPQSALSLISAPLCRQACHTTQALPAQRKPGRSPARSFTEHLARTRVSASRRGVYGLDTRPSPLRLAQHGHRRKASRHRISGSDSGPKSVSPRWRR